MPGDIPNLRIVPAEPPMVYMQPHHADIPPVLYVGGVKVLIEDKGRASQWVRILTDYILSRPLGG